MGFSQYWISAPPPPFIFVPLSPSLAAALDPLAYSSRSARSSSLIKPPRSDPQPISPYRPTDQQGWGYKNEGRGVGQISFTVIEPKLVFSECQCVCLQYFPSRMHQYGVMAIFGKCQPTFIRQQ